MNFKDVDSCLGRLIGKGCSKKVYELKDDGSRVVLVTYAQYGILEEWGTLLWLEERGFPVMQIESVFQKHYDGDVYVLAERASASRLNQEGVVFDLSVFNEKTLESIHNIRALLQKHKCYMSDFQYLIKNDGSLVISDPGDLCIITDSNDWQRSYGIMNTDLKKSEMAVAYSKHLRSQGQTVWAGSIWNFWAETEDYVRARGSAEAA
ncbi:hypothetical protein [Myxococcus phage Mx1]|nr:hypothetical protein [Myxococcus phage Mx1]